jgi:hypothetical protein
MPLLCHTVTLTGVKYVALTSSSKSTHCASPSTFPAATLDPRPAGCLASAWVEQQLSAQCKQQQQPDNSSSNSGRSCYLIMAAAAAGAAAAALAVEGQVCVVSL